ncbi:hypothetical protein Hamer_G021434 [Homarus americanus]|uniref:Uncharacterized protein n=1 Tax=Homarus americanus TaxID=6706 RepID=A0A8J5JUD7_HOMAM|nr:hypothetical protein Hamer_G021434 [Homarus americanus]
MPEAQYPYTPTGAHPGYYSPDYCPAPLQSAFGKGPPLTPSSSHRGPPFTASHTRDSVHGSPIPRSHIGAIPGSHISCSVPGSQHGGLMPGSQIAGSISGSQMGGPIRGSKNGVSIPESQIGTPLPETHHRTPVPGSHNGGPQIQGSHNQSRVLGLHGQGPVLGPHNVVPVREGQIPGCHNGGPMPNCHSGGPFLGCQNGCQISGCHNKGPVTGSLREGTSSGVHGKETVGGPHSLGMYPGSGVRQPGGENGVLVAAYHNSGTHMTGDHSGGPQSSVHNTRQLHYPTALVYPPPVPVLNHRGVPYTTPRGPSSYLGPQYTSYGTPPDAALGYERRVYPPAAGIQQCQAYPESCRPGTQYSPYIHPAKDHQQQQVSQTCSRPQVEQNAHAVTAKVELNTEGWQTGDLLDLLQQVHLHPDEPPSREYTKPRRRRR